MLLVNVLFDEKLHRKIIVLSCLEYASFLP